MSEHRRVSLLFPRDAPATPARPAALNFDDLGITAIARALDIDGRHGRFVSNTLAALETNLEVIRYRQAALADLVAQPALAAQLTAVLPNLYALAEAGPTARWQENTPLPVIGARLSDLNAYVTCVEQLWQALEAARPELSAQAWLGLHSMLGELRADEEYLQLAAELPGLRDQLDQAGSITIGINLDGQLQPEGATILAINRGRFAGKGGMLERLLGERNTADTVRGISALYKTSEGQQRLPEHELFRDMSRLLERVVAPVASALERYTRVNAIPLTSLTPEIVLYLGALRLKQRLEAASLPMSLPTAEPVGARVCSLHDTYSVELALRLGPAASSIVCNTVETGTGAPIALLTGPNSGGKTTYARAIAQAQVLFQAGLFVPGSAARLSPVDGVWSHFATAERPGGSGGRLAEELERVAAIFKHASGNSLLIFNEPFSSTDPRSARLLGRDVIAGLKLLGARTIYITHLHELVDDLVDQGDEADGVVCFVADVAPTHNGASDDVPTFAIVRGRPQASEHARELARQYGVTRLQLEQALRERLSGPFHTPPDVRQNT